MHALDAPDHAGGWSVDAHVEIPAWDRGGLERLVRYCARPPLAQERLGRLDDEHLVYRLRKPTVDGRTEPILTPLELLDRLARLVTPRSAVGLIAARCWALLLARIYECLPLSCPRCGEPMRVIGFILDPPVIARILEHVG